MTDAELRSQLEQYKWYHTIELLPGLCTPGVPEIARSHPPVLRQMDKLDFRDRRILDIGCRDGLFSFEAERRGAAEVVAIDSNVSKGAVELLIPFFKSRVQLRELSLFDLRAEEHRAFDIVLFLGVLYHLRYPFSALKILTDVPSTAVECSSRQVFSQMTTNARFSFARSAMSLHMAGVRA